MKPMAKEDAAKAAKLFGAVVTVFGCAAWRVVGASTPSAPPAAQTETVVAAPPSSEPVKKNDGIVEVPSLFAAAVTDPFRSLQSEKIASTRQTPPALSGAITPLPLPGPSGPLQPTPLNTVPIEAPLRLSGVLPGAHATAVVEIGAETRVVRLHSRLNGGYEVVRISATSVTLRRDGKETILSVME